MLQVAAGRSLTCTRAAPTRGISNPFSWPGNQVDGLESVLRAHLQDVPAGSLQVFGGSVRIDEALRRDGRHHRDGLSGHHNVSLLRTTISGEPLCVFQPTVGRSNQNAGVGASLHFLRLNNPKPPLRFPNLRFAVSLQVWRSREEQSC